METIKCDIIISGAGMAGLSLLYRAMKSGMWKDKNIIVLDKNDKKENDKTWSFWKKEVTSFDEVIYCTWERLLFFSNSGEEIKLNSSPYTYNSIRSIDFYNHVLEYIKMFPNVSFYKTEILSIESSANECTLTTPSVKYLSKFIFNSVFEKPKLNNGDQYFLQHFKGIKIKTDYPLNGDLSAYLMDFRTSQEHGTTFFYTLPINSKEIFIEYTIFSKQLLSQNQYDSKIKEYISQVLNISEYEIMEQEYGVIPMTDHIFTRRKGNVFNIGSVGGDTRASTGYTFVNTQKTISKLLKSLKENGNPFEIVETVRVKENLYDSTLLNVLDKGKYKGHQVFTDLFRGTDANLVFSFLDAETSFLEDLRIMKSLKSLPFAKSFFAALFKRMLR